MRNTCKRNFNKIKYQLNGPEEFRTLLYSRNSPDLSSGGISFESQSYYIHYGLPEFSRSQLSALNIILLTIHHLLKSSDTIKMEIEIASLNA
jgi:hypothetical protein